MSTVPTPLAFVLESAILRGGDGALAFEALFFALAAALGTGALARRLGCSRGAALVAAALAASTTSPALPWMLLGLELGRRATGTQSSVLGLALAALALALGALGKDAGTLVALVLAALSWVAFARGPEPGAARSVLPSVFAIAIGALASVAIERGLANSAAPSGPLVTDASDTGAIDLVSLGLLVIVAALVARWRTLARSEAADARGGAYLGMAGVVIAIGAWVWIAEARGASSDWRALFPFGAGGSPLLLVACGPALALLFDPKLAASGPRALATIAPIAIVSTLLALRLCTSDAVWSRLPILGLASPADLAPIAVVTLAVGAALALDRVARGGRIRAAFALAVLASIAFALERGPVLPEGREPIDPDDELVGGLCVPAQHLASNALHGGEFALWVHPSLDVDARLCVEPLDAAQGVARLELERADDSSKAEIVRGRVLPDGARTFVLARGLVQSLAPGWWTLRVEFTRAGTGEVLGQRLFAHVHAPPSAMARWSPFAVLVSTLLLLSLGRPGARADKVGWLALALFSLFL